MSDIKRIKLGETYGTLQVIKDLGTDSAHHHYYMCRCESCGRTEKISRNKLIKHTVPTCSFCSTKRDFKGQTIKGFYVIEETDKRNSNRSIIWRCRCKKCETVYEIAANNLAKQVVPKCNCSWNEAYNAIEATFFEQVF